MNRAAWLALSTAGAAFAQELPAGKTKALVQRACTGCHELVIGSKQRMDRERWATLVEDMVEKGARLSDVETAEVIDYLTANFGPKLNINQASMEQLIHDLGLAQRDAAALVKYREAHGPFKDFSSLKKVPELDQAKIDALKDRLVF